MVSEELQMPLLYHLTFSASFVIYQVAQPYSKVSEGFLFPTPSLILHPPRSGCGSDSFHEHGLGIFSVPGTVLVLEHSIVQKSANTLSS